MDCIHESVGITKDTTLPFWDGLDSDLQDQIIASTSGLYVDDLPGGIDLRTIIDSSYMSKVLQDALRARDEAEKLLASDMVVAIANRFQSSKPKFIGDIGRKSVSKTMSVPQRYVGQRYRMNEPIAGKIQVVRLEVNVSASVNMDVIIARCDRGEVGIGETLHTLPVTSVAGMWTVVPLPTDGILLPMQVNGVPQEYYIYYDRQTAAVMPKDNEIKCGTCTGINRIDPLGEFMEYHGVRLNDLSKLRNVSADKMAMGLCVNAVVACESDSVLCREYEKKEDVQKLIDQAIRFKAGELWIEYIFKSGYINKINLQNREYMWGKRNHFRAEYEKRVTTAANNMTLGETGCYSCKEDRVVKGNIFA